MALNRYRLKHLAENQKHAGAILASRLLSKPDRLIGLILLGNNFVNIIITQLATFIGYRVFGDAGIAIATGFLTFALLIFAEVAPKTLAAMHPERFAFPAAFVYTPLLKIAYPLVWLINWFANGLLRLFSIPTGVLQSTALNQDELRSVVSEAKGLIHDSHQDMLLRVLDLEKITVEDIMVPRTEIIGIDLDEKWEDIEEQLRQVNYTRLPAYRGNINEVVGYLHMRRIMNLLANDRLTLGELEHTMRPAYFIPESTSLTQQLINFKKDRRRHAL
jgi:Mg2+/Co2+ transporter CorB